MQAATKAAKCSLGMASRAAQVRWRSLLLLSLTGTTLCLSYHQYTKANTTHKLHWHACTQGHVHAPIVLPHAFKRWCGCAMGTSLGPKQAVAHVFMPVMSVGNPSRWIAANMGVRVQRMVCMRLLALTGSTGAPNTSLYWSLQQHKMRPNENFPFNLCKRGAYIIFHPTLKFDEIRAGGGDPACIKKSCNIAPVI